MQQSYNFLVYVEIENIVIATLYTVEAVNARTT